MPKVISRTTISSSDAKSYAPSTLLKVYYCICGEFILVCDKPLNDLPQRPLDRSSVLRCLASSVSSTGAPQKVRKASIFKVSAVQGKPKLIQRLDDTFEKQYPFHCSRCNLQIGYEHTPPPIKSGGKFTFILPGALTDRQGIPPPDVFLDQSSPSNNEREELNSTDQTETDDRTITTH